MKYVLISCNHNSFGYICILSTSSKLDLCLTEGLLFQCFSTAHDFYKKRRLIMQLLLYFQKVQQWGLWDTPKLGNNLNKC